MQKSASRSWRRTEKFSEYFNEKVIMANKLNLSEEETIAYLIDGIDILFIITQAKVKEFTSLSHMLNLTNDLTPIENHQQSIIPVRGVHLQDKYL